MIASVLVAARGPPVECYNEGLMFLLNRFLYIVQSEFKGLFKEREIFKKWF